MEIQIQSCDGEGRLSQFMSELGTLQKLCGIWLNVRIGQMQRIFKTDMTKKIHTACGEHVCGGEGYWFIISSASLLKV